jgi:hypothetical protein
MGSAVDLRNERAPGHTRPTHARRRAAAHLATPAARLADDRQEGVVDVVQQLAQLLALRLRHVAPQQLVASGLVLADALHLRLDAHLLEHAAQEGACVCVCVLCVCVWGGGTESGQM